MKHGNIFLTHTISNKNAKPMKQKIINYFSSISPLTEQEAAAISESSVIKEFEKGTILLKEGQLSVNSYFVLQGLVR